MYTVTTSIEIAAPPATVREKFLDFPSIPKYSPEGFIRSIVPVTDKSPVDLQAGDKLNCTVGYGKMQFSPIVQENSPSLFSWVGSIPGIFTGEHAFRFEGISSGEGQQIRTRLVHEEKFTGLLSFLMGENILARSAGMVDDMKKKFGGFNEDFKAWVEEGAVGGSVDGGNKDGAT
ncbi:SRPBCC domain-containing protein [Aspergillus clavatus NRRL 1]|uniref:Uncharacterized protein n=1 Tax=Aspergillus clavatus (strain ATCC 1007 / CBS 513.65 / DSM 816 / NCTC 3887 / NRRL 1 / QM 1276 / 107) TaxID=344612 RepID=A1C8T7_ASPCL|nr:uncharacterized protein ACLA_044440 [Aspergillus clavatus NRRL 1]EAW13724.1 conserved hypothetical protein [Aspergillus clavatus NRRL 1]